jgi:hypothetical protein
MSDSGSRMGAVTCRKARSGAVIVAISLPLSCSNFLQQRLHRLVRYVVVLDVMSSARSALGARVCRIRAETRGWGCPPPVFVQASGPSGAVSRVVYKRLLCLLSYMGKQQSVVPEFADGRPASRSGTDQGLRSRLAAGESF